MTLTDLIKHAEQEGYAGPNARAKVCQDIILKAISKSSFSRKVTIKGGVVMRSVSNDARRATQDIDMDFIRYSISDDAIDEFLRKLNCLGGITIERTGKITELKQQDYHGKRVMIIIRDDEGRTIRSKIDLGVHKHLEIEQPEYCFEIGTDDEGVSLLINSYEQMFTEKLRSFLKFGEFSTRYKDIFDMYYLTGCIDSNKLKDCINLFIIDDPGMRENSLEDVFVRFSNGTSDEEYLRNLKASDKNWLNMDPREAIEGIKETLNGLLK